MNSPYSMADIETFVSRFYSNQKLTLVPYAYNLTFAGLAQGTSATQNLVMQANADFVLLGIKHRANIAAAQNVSTKTAPFIRCLITDTGSNNQLTNSAVDLENYSSNGDGIFRPFPYPRIVSGRSALAVQLTNYAPTAETYAIDLMFEGVQVYPMG